MIEGALVDKAIEILMEGLVDKVDAQVKYVLGFEHEFETMKENLKTLQSYLNDMEKHKDKYKTVEDASAKLRELIYRIDDLVVDCQNRVDYEKMKNSYSSSISPRGLYFRNQVGKKLAEINREIVNMRQNLNIVAPTVSLYKSEELSSSGSGRVRWTSDIFNEYQTVGLAEDTRILKRWIIPCNGSLHLIGIVGMGGVGKTTLAQKIYNDRGVTSCFDMRIWVCKSTFDELEIMKSILQQLKKNDHGSDRNVLLKRIHEALSNKKYLIVMDDVWSIDDGWWKWISGGLPKSEKQSSCVIITSRNEDVVKRMGVKEEQIHRPELLSEEEGWLLFCKVAFVSSKGKCKDTELERVGKDILRKCGGLPLAIKTIGGLLSSKLQLLSVWQPISEDLPQIFADECNSHDSLLATLQRSYDELPLKLKRCILCFAIYPEDYEIEFDQLANWWIGEGFVYQKGKKIARKMALECLSELISRCLVEAVRKRNYDGRVYSCKMHDMIREMIIKVAKEESFCSLDGNNANIATIHSRRLGVTNETLLQPLDGNSKLRALLLTKANCIGFTRKVALAKVKTLRVLDLSHIKFEKSSEFCENDMWRWITSLKRLGYLSFQDVANLTKLPRSIKKLWGLQILVLAECKNLKQLPRSITSLPKLIVLDVGNCTSLSYLPLGLSKLSHLQELYGFKIPDTTTPNACHLRDLKGLRELRVLQLDVMDGSMIEEDELTVLEQFQQLRMLIINAGDRKDEIFLERLEKLSPPKSLEELYLRHFCGNTTPAWIAPELLDRLQYLCIEDSNMLQHMSDRFRGSEGNKWKIEGLCLKFLPKLEETWEEIKSAMPRLKYVEVSHCSSVKSFTCAVKNIGFWRKPEEENEELEEPDAASSMEEHHESYRRIDVDESVH
ncbi:disease resistance RPP13-like protein 4 isoform X3 [Lycium barbarum]|nr:disease resistance RPP13-like protein 4 isoform X3 [Lycium barbarum]XP_060187869.1 disease resistance RPP13-like protein 4 isoform X3 [Lycium barbarum]XP_060187870.1 disease resistance RPP13-like protein 4 isoform X3 [Lycium barbarum]XP_060187871.1 disease resistance RPP13-like protein 4 isoform X3 [Lycium barbarum]XP_060187872.1 disease resistance RPP13-like protein 4 isoform X3 [Lycium barbarum]XP_060187873.1 disease resistance RPP13-like protein 4 isoform X3 [Lycium barbarum]XP_06018787